MACGCDRFEKTEFMEEENVMQLTRTSGRAKNMGSEN
jgi:hypothetical protein